MTKFILVGGYIQKAADGGEAFCNELVRDCPKPTKILDCMFARLEEHWAESFKGDQELFGKFISDFELKLASYDNFEAEVKWADAIFFRGGSSEELVKALRERPEWKNYIGGKTVAGTSAGADALSKYYFGLDTLEIREGLGLVNAKTIPHFKSDYHSWEFDWESALTSLQNFNEELPLFALHEGEFKVVSTNDPSSYQKLYRYTSNGEGIWSAGKRLLPENLIEEAREQHAWMPKPQLPEGEYRFFLTEKGKEQYEKTLLHTHKKYLTNIACEEIDFARVGMIVYKDEWQVVAKATQLE